MARIGKVRKAGAEVKAAVKKLTSWSWSRYSTYFLCPFKAYLKFILKLKEPPAPALDRGSIIHKQAECFIKGLPCPILDESKPLPKLGPDGEFLPGEVVKYHKAGVLPPELKKVAKQLNEAAVRFKKKTITSVVEDMWVFTKTWAITRWDDWAGAWARIKVDYGYIEGDTFYFKDWKTGKFHADLHDEYLETLELYALAAMIRFPQVKNVRPSLEYTDLGVSYPGKGDKAILYTRKDVPALKEAWEERVFPMLNDTKFAPRPNNKCHWCAFGAAQAAREGKDPKSAPCKF